MAIQEKYLRPDSKGRITLGKLAKGISSYKYEISADGCIILRPQVEIPANETWLYKNKEALSKVQKGIEDSSCGHVRKIGSFSQFADDDVEQ